MRPLPPLTEFSAHEQQFFSWLGKHVAEEQAQIGKFLPGIPRHFIDQRTLAVDHLVMGQRQHEVLRKPVQHAEGELVVMKLAVNRIIREIEQGVVHPAHVPFHAKSQAAHIGGLRHHRPRR